MHDNTILIVDDVGATRSGLAELLRLRGYETLEADSGETALRTLKSHRETKLIILDVHMPGAGGLWFREQQVQDASIADIPVAVFTGGELPSASLGFCALLRKPVSIDELLRVVEIYCGA